MINNKSDLQYLAKKSGFCNITYGTVGSSYIIQKLSLVLTSNASIGTTTFASADSTSRLTECFVLTKY